MTAKTDANRVFFPLASVFGLLYLPVSVYALTRGHGLLAGLRTPLDHAHEMLFGYTLGVAAGYLLNNVPRWWVVGLCAAWLTARLSFLPAPHGVIAASANALFALGFALAGASRFLRSAKKWRNRAFGLVIVLLGAAAIASHMAMAGLSIRVTYVAIYEGVLAIALLMLLVGGRAIAPAAAGHIEKQGLELEARVQPRIEAVIIITSLTAMLSFPLAPRMSGVLIICCGVAGLVRLLRWRLWLCLDRADLVSLAVGYAWVAAGLALTGASFVTGLRITLALHAITVGGVGTLTTTVMARTWILRSSRSGTPNCLFAAMTLLVAMAACFRLASDFCAPASDAVYKLAAALCWSAALFLLIAGIFLRYPRRVRKKA